MYDLLPSTKCLSAKPNSDVETWIQDSRTLGRKILKKLFFAGFCGHQSGFCGNLFVFARIELLGRPPYRPQPAGLKHNDNDQDLARSRKILQNPIPQNPAKSRKTVAAKWAAPKTAKSRKTSQNPAKSSKIPQNAAKWSAHKAAKSRKMLQNGHRQHVQDRARICKNPQ